jgi:hypothetical protein
LNVFSRFLPVEASAETVHGSWPAVTIALVSRGAFALVAQAALAGDEAPLGELLKDGLVGAAALVPAVGVSSLIQRAFYGSEPPPAISVIRLPRWATAYSVVVWPPIWSIVEEMTYLGYVYPVSSGLRVMVSSQAGSSLSPGRRSTLPCRRCPIDAISPQGC